MLGILAFADSLLNMGEIFRRINSVLFMLLSLGLLVRTTTKKKDGTKERLKRDIYVLEQKLRTMEQGREKLGKF
ncbi:MAG: hypothetical protein RBT76_14810 [candidate division Zixibacteria bacterium]|jgi:hypothetical protein|nr:hypothetical protein [candidate division Zixibacteria bacterium]